MSDDFSPQAGTAPSAGGADALAQIAAIRGDPTHAFHRGHAGALDAMNALYRQAYGQPDADAPDALKWFRPTAPYELATDLPEDALPTVLRQTVEGTTFELGFDRATAQGIFDWALGRAAAPPALPESRTTADAAEKSLRAEWGTQYDRQLWYAKAGVRILDEIRAENGHGHGQIWETLRRTGYDNDPKTIKFFAQLGQYYRQTEKGRFRQYATRRESGD
jgi:hypothetical protein